MPTIEQGSSRQLTDFNPNPFLAARETGLRGEIQLRLGRAAMAEAAQALSLLSGLTLDASWQVGSLRDLSFQLDCHFLTE